MESPSSSRPSTDDAEREEMLDRMLTRLALADDSKLQPLLSKILPYSISSLSSPSPSIRKMVMEILGHINKRVKYQLDIGLPLLELWNLYQEGSSNPMIRNFCIMYIEMAFDRLPMEEKEKMAPELISDIAKVPKMHQDIILRIIVKVIGECHSSKIEDDIANKYKLINHGRDREIFIEFCLQVILYQPTTPSAGSSSGLSKSQSERVTGRVPLKGEALFNRKIGILNIVDAMDLSPDTAYPLFLVACCDSQEPVVKKGEELLKRKTPGVNLEDRDLIGRLFLLFNGTAGVETVAAESRVSPGSLALKLRLMSVFCRSIAAANAFPSTLQCIFGCFYGGGTTSRLKQMGMEFTVWVFKHASIDQLKFMGPVILGGILKLLDTEKNTESEIVSGDVKSFAFQALGLLAVRMPQLFRDKIDMVMRLFNALKVEDQSLRLTIQEATTSLASAYKDAPLAVLEEIEVLLLENIRAEQNEIRFCVVRWATSVFNMHHYPSRFICMVAADDSRMDIREMACEGLCLTKNDEQKTGLGDPLFPKTDEMLGYITKQQPKLLDDADKAEKLLFPSRMFLAMINFLMKCFDADCQREGFSAKLEPPAYTLCLLLEHAMSFEGSVELHSTASKALVTIGSWEPKLVSNRYAERISWLKQLLVHIDSDTRESASRLLGFACSSLSLPRTSELINDLICSVRDKKVVRFENHHGAVCAIGYVVAECVKENLSLADSLLQSTLTFLVTVVETESASLASIAMEALGHIGLRHPLPRLLRECVPVGIMEIVKERLRKLLSNADIKASQKIVISLGHLSFMETSLSQTRATLDLIFTLSRSKVEDVLFAAGEALSFIWGGVPVTADVILKSNFTSLSQTSNFLTREVLSSSVQTDQLIDDTNVEYHTHVREVIIRELFDTLLYSSRKEDRCAGTVWLVSLLMFCGHHPKIQQLLPEIQEAFSHLLGDQHELTQELASQGMSIVYELGDASMKQDLVNALVSTLTGSGKRKRAVKLMEESEVFQEGSLGERHGGGKLSTYKELCSLANEMGQPDLIYKFMDLANYQASLNSKRGAAFGFSKIAKLAGEALQPHLSSLIPRLFRYQFDPDKNVQDAMTHIWKSIVVDSKQTIDKYLDLILDDLLVQSGSRLWRSREASCHALADVIQGRTFSQVSKYMNRLWTAAFRSMDDIKETVRSSGDTLCRSLSSLTIRLCDISLTAASEAGEAMSMVLPLLLTEGMLSKVPSVQKVSISVVMKLSKSAGVTLRPHLSDLICCMLESLSSLEDQRLNYVELHAGNVGINADKLDHLRISVAKDSPMWETIDYCLKVVDAKSLDSLVPRLAQVVRSGVGLNTRVGVANFVTLLVEKVNTEIQPFTHMLLKLLFHAVIDEKGGAAKKAFAAACAITLKYAGPSQALKLIEDTASLHLGDRNAKISCTILIKNYSNFAAEIVGGYHAIILPISFISRQNTCTVVLGELNISFCSYNYQAKYLHRCIGRIEHQLLQLQLSGGFYGFGNHGDGVKQRLLIKTSMAQSNQEHIYLKREREKESVTLAHRFEDEKDVSSLFEELWEENASSERISLQLHLPETVSLLHDCLGSSSWSSKKKSAKAIRKLCEVLGESVAPFHRVLLECLLKEMPGRLWEGKDAILDAMGAICSSCHRVICIEEPAIINSVLTLVSSACTKKVRLYREAALRCLCQILDAFNNPQFFQGTFPLLVELSNEACSTNPANMPRVNIIEKTGEDSSDHIGIPFEKVLECVSSCIRMADIPQIFGERANIIHIFSNALSPGLSWTVKTSAFTSILALCLKFNGNSHISSDLSEDGKLLLNEIFHSIAPKVVESIVTIKISQVHVAASQCLLEIVNVYKVVPLEERREPGFKDAVIHLSEVEKSEEAKTLLKRCIAAMETLQQDV